MEIIGKCVLIAVTACGLLACSFESSRGVPQLGRDPVKKVIAAMTLEEKAYFVTGTGMSLPVELDAEKPAPAPVAPVVGQAQSLVAGAAGTTYEIPRLGIPAMVLADGPAGLRISPTRDNDNETYYCTAFPVATLLASTWDTELAYEVGRAMGNEVLEYGVDVLLGPGMNLHRNPLCGRNFEYYSEDPMVTGKIAASVINGVESRGVGTAPKHFAANNTETNRNALNTIVSERALREIYLEGFRIAVEEARPLTVMSAYNLINGVHASESGDLLTKVLRDDWGFKGFVMSDWFGGVDPVAQMKAGNDLLMPGTVNQANAILNAVREGRLQEKVLNRNIERILTVLMQVPRFKRYRYSNKPDLTAHAALARRAAAEGVVLLKNDNRTLPFGPGIQRLAAFGNTSYEIITGGTGSGDVNEAYSVSLVDGLQGAGYRVEGKLRNAYKDYLRAAKEAQPPAEAFMPQSPVSEMPVAAVLLGAAASTADVALITIGRNSGEFFDRKVEGDFNLTREEKDLIKRVSDAFHARGKKAVVVLNIGGVVEVASWRSAPDAILLAWQPGQEAGNSIADVISGRVNPSGKLASTFPVKYTDVPSAENFPGAVLRPEEQESEADILDGLSAFLQPKPSRIAYEEGIYVGYRYYETFGMKPAYEFGYGLSYTSFEYRNLSLSSKKFSGGIAATVEVRNSGEIDGREVVQLYLSAPSKKLDKPSVELKGFAKTRLLQPGESQILKFEISLRDLASFNPKSSSWIAEAGRYEVQIGASSRNIRQTASFELEEEKTVEKANPALVPKEPINEWKPAR
jgi:beta-glucosidase